MKKLEGMVERSFVWFDFYCGKVNIVFYASEAVVCYGLLDIV